MPKQSPPPINKPKATAISCACGQLQLEMTSEPRAWIAMGFRSPKVAVNGDLHA
jgi:hypothetical protein